MKPARRDLRLVRRLKATYQAGVFQAAASAAEMPEASADTDSAIHWPYVSMLSISGMQCGDTEEAKSRKIVGQWRPSAGWRRSWLAYVAWRNAKKQCQPGENVAAGIGFSGAGRLLAKLMFVRPQCGACVSAWHYLQLANGIGVRPVTALFFKIHAAWRLFLAGYAA